MGQRDETSPCALCEDVVTGRSSLTFGASAQPNKIVEAALSWVRVCIDLQEERPNTTTFGRFRQKADRRFKSSAVIWHLSYSTDTSA